jgi:hypothetical protein
MFSSKQIKVYKCPELPGVSTGPAITARTRPLWRSAFEIPPMLLARAEVTYDNRL